MSSVLLFKDFYIARTLNLYFVPVAASIDVFL